MKKIYLIFIFILFNCCSKDSTINNVHKILFRDLTFLYSKIKIGNTILDGIKNSKLISLYKYYNDKIIWVSKKEKSIILEELKNSENEGLMSKEYNFKKLLELEKKYHLLNQKELIAFDLLFTQSLQKYLEHITKGKLSPNLLYEDWDLKPHNIDVNKLFIDAKNKRKFDYLKPKHEIYINLKIALKTLKKYPNDTISALNFDLNSKEKIKLNSTHPSIKTLKYKLMYWKDLKKKDTVTNILDAETEIALKQFQSRHGLEPDGILGKRTVTALNFTREQRIQQIIVNLERWRWFEKDFGNNYLLVNIPDYSIIAIKNKDTLQKQKIVVGKLTRQTPILVSKLNSITFNPNWTVPPTILKEDIYTKAINDSTIFKRKGLTILDKSNNVIKASNWNINDAKNYKYVQKPGRNNALGVMKINFNNKFSVYLHDTNHRDLFANNYRSLSSGCVRLEKPLEMAEYLLNDSRKWNLKVIQDTTNINTYINYNNQILKSKLIKDGNTFKDASLTSIPIENKKAVFKTIHVKIPDDVKLQQLYWTAWFEKGNFQFREDIYNLDKELYIKLRN